MKSISILVFVFVLGAAVFAEAAPAPIESMNITGGTFSLWVDTNGNHRMDGSESFFFTTPYTFFGPNTDLVSGYIGAGGAGRSQNQPDPNRIVGFDFPDRDGAPNTNDFPVNTYTALSNLGDNNTAANTQAGGPIPSGTVDATAGTITMDMSSWFANWRNADIHQGGIASGNYDGITGAYTMGWTNVMTVSGTTFTSKWEMTGTVSPVPLPAAVILFGTGLVSLAGIFRQRLLHSGLC